MEEVTFLALWIERIVPIMIASFLVFIMGVRRQMGEEEQIDFVLNCINCVISILMGIVAVLLFEAVWSHMHPTNPTNEDMAIAAGVIGALTSYRGIVYIIDKVVHLIEWRLGKETK